MKSIYLAGPDVFREDAIKFFDQLKSLVRSHGFNPLPPLDNGIEFKEGEFNTQQTADNIFKANVDLINRSEIILANLTPFRGVCIDDGTAWEIGYGFSKGKVIYGYTEDCHILLKDKSADYLKSHSCGDFSVIEDFGYGANLMICSSIKLSGGAIFRTIEECLEQLRVHHG